MICDHCHDDLALGADGCVYCRRGFVDLEPAAAPLERHRDETFLWGPCMFDVETAKRLARRPGLPVYPIKPHKCLQGLPVRVPETVDLEQPVIFATFLNDARDRIGAVMIDGQHRLAYALAHGATLHGVILNPVETVHLCAGFSQLGKGDWKRLFEAARHIGLTWGR